MGPGKDSELPANSPGDKLRLARQANPQTPRALSEGLLASLKDLANLPTDIRILKSSTLVVNLGEIARAMRPRRCDDDLIGVGVNDQVGVVSDDYHLPAHAGFSEAVYQLVKHRLRIEILLGLVDLSGACRRCDLSRDREATARCRACPGRVAQCRRRRIGSRI